MKKSVYRMAMMLLVLMMAGLACAEEGAPAVQEQRLFVDNRETDKTYPERLNLRDTPSKEGGIIGLYYTGAEVENLGQENDSYTKVQIGGMTGYMATEFLITAEEAEARYGKDGGFGAYRAALVDLTGMGMKQLALLADTDHASAQLATLENFADVGLVAVLDDWAYICATVDGQKLYGYVPLDTLTDVGDLRVSIVAGSEADTRTFLYSAPNDRGEEIMVLKNGTACFNLFGRKEGNWRRVRVGGVSGWIRYTQVDNLYDLGGHPRSMVPYYPLQMKAKRDALLHKQADGTSHYLTLGKDMPVEVLAECGDYAYVRTMEGGIGAYDCGDFGFVKFEDLTLAPAEAGVGVAQVDDGDLPALLFAQPDEASELLGALCSGASVRIVDYTQTNFVRVALGDVEGYVAKDAIRLLTYDGAAVSEKIPQRANVTTATQLRAKMSASGKNLGEVPEGSRVYMLGHFGDWAFVQFASKAGLDVTDSSADGTGFVPLRALSAPASTTHLVATLTGDKVNLRAEASATTGAIIGRVRLGERVRVADYGVEWTKVTTEADKSGYLKTEYLKFD